MLKLALVGAIILATFFAIIFVERAARRVQVHYAKRVVGRKVYGGQNTHIPLKLNTSGVIPPIFASSLLMFPATVGTFVSAGIIQTISSWIQPGSWLYEILFVGLIFFFCYF